MFSMKSSVIFSISSYVLLQSYINRGLSAKHLTFGQDFYKASVSFEIWIYMCHMTKELSTRMHSSGMRTARLLTASQHALHRGCIPACTAQGVYPSMHWAGGFCPWGCTCPGVSAQGGVPAWGCSCLGDVYSMQLGRHLWKHNLRKLRLRAVKIILHSSPVSGQLSDFP